MTEESTSFHLKNFVIFLAALGVLALLLFISGRIFYKPSKSATISYDNFEFTEMEGNWYTQWKYGDQLYTLSLRHNPYEVESVVEKGKLNDAFNDRENVYITIDPNLPREEYKYLTLAVSELSLSLSRALGRTPVAACTKNNTEVCFDRPIVSCTDQNKSIIFLASAGTPAIIALENCVILQGDDINLLKSVDKFLYKWYGIIK